MSWLTSTELRLTFLLLLLCAMKTVKEIPAERVKSIRSLINISTHSTPSSLPIPQFLKDISESFLPSPPPSKAYECFSSSRLSWPNTFFSRPQDRKCRDFSKMSLFFRLKSFCSQLSAAVAQRTQSCCLRDSIDNYRLQGIASLTIWFQFISI